MALLVLGAKPVLWPDGSELVHGRHRDCDVQIPDEKSSRRHAGGWRRHERIRRDGDEGALPMATPRHARPAGDGMLIGLCASALAAQETLAAAPIDYIEEHVQNFLAPEGDEAAFAERVARAAKAGKPVLAANCFLPAGLKCVGEAVDLPRLKAYAESAFRRARAAGIDTIVFGSGGARQLAGGFAPAKAAAQFVALLRELGPLADRHEVTLAIEPLNRGECNFINTLGEGAEVARAVAHPRVRLLADLYHMLRNGEEPAALAPVAPLLAHVHIAERETRSAPGVKGDDFKPFLRELRRGGYGHRISFECGWGDLATELPIAVASLRRQLAEVGFELRAVA